MTEPPDDFEGVRVALSRQRRLGVGFAQAWPLAFAALDRPITGRADAEALDTARAALATTEEVWRCGYERLPPPVPKYGWAAAARLRALGLAPVAA